MSTSLTITHTHAEGTLIEGTSRGDGSADVLKAVSGRGGAWRWSRNLGSWYVQRSRDTRAKTALINATKAALEKAGFTVTVDIDDTYRTTEDAETAAVARQEQRAEALEAKADRKAAAAQSAWANEQHAHSLLPPMGQPILVGHHSEARHRKAIERADTATRKAIDATDAAETAASRAAAAAGTTGFRYAPAVIRRRIERLNADLRRLERTRDGHTRTVFVDGRGVKHVETIVPAGGAYRDRVLADITHTQDQITYWTRQLEQAAQAGAAVWDAATIVPGDLVHLWGEWTPVAKVNTKTVRVAGYGGLLPFDKITRVRTADGAAVRIVGGVRTIEAADQAGG